MKLVAYTRVSRIGGRDVESESFITVKEQLRQIEAYAEAMGHTIVGRYSDLDESGGKASRPEFDKALASVVENGADGLIVAKLDRFSRSVADALAILKALNAKGKQIVSVTDQVDTSTAMGRAMWQIIMVFAELERERASENWKAALSNAVGRGVHVASRTPTGYRRKEDGRLEPDPVAAPVVAELFERRTLGAGWSELARFLNESGVVGPYSAANWTHAAVAKLIHNRVYLGEARNGKHVNPDAHPAIVSRAVWEAANVRNGHTAPARATDTLLAGLVRCAGCRYLVKADKMNDRDGGKLRVYRCRGDHASGKCEHKAYALARVLEPYVEQQFLAELANLGPDAPLAQASGYLLQVDEAQHAADAADLELSVYVEGTSASGIGADAFQRGLKKRQQTLDEARERLSELRAKQPAAEMLNVNLADEWPEMAIDEKREILTLAIDAVMIRQATSQAESIGDRVRILWRGEAPSDLPRRGFRPPLKQFEV